MQITAKLIKVLPLQTGMGRNGEWKRQDIIVETQEQYPKKICLGIWGDRIEDEKLKVDNMLQIDFDIESREYNERWYTNLKAWKIEVVQTENPEVKNELDPPPFETLDDFEAEDDEDVLPF